MYYSEASNDLAGPISSSLHLGNTAFEEMSQQWRAVGNTVSDLTGSRFELQTCRSRDEHVTPRPTAMLLLNYFSTVLLIVFDLHDEELCDGLSSSQCYIGCNSWLTTSCTVELSFSMLSKLVAKIAISPQIMFANIWDYM